MEEERKEVAVTVTKRGDNLESRVIRVTGEPVGTYYLARVYWNGEVVNESEKIFDMDFAFQRADSLREEFYLNKAKGRSR